MVAIPVEDLGRWQVVYMVADTVGTCIGPATMPMRKCPTVYFVGEHVLLSNWCSFDILLVLFVIDSFGGLLLLFGFVVVEFFFSWGGGDKNIFHIPQGCPSINKVEL